MSVSARFKPVRGIANAIDANLYWVFCVLVGGVLFYFRAYGKYDFWEHAAAVKAFQQNYFSPPHPYLNLPGISHHFFSPYHLLAALLANNLGTNNLQMLVVLGFVNLGVFFVVFYYFVKANFHECTYWKYVAFYALLFMLFLWGRNPWLWSGFYHAKFIKEEIYLPSAFAFNLFLANGILLKSYFRKPKWPYLFLILTFQWLMVLIHPNTAVSAVVFYLALAAFHDNAFFGKDVWVVLAISVLAFVLTLCWPFYSFFDLLQQKDVGSFNGDSHKLYENFWSIGWPALIAIPFVLRRLLANRYDFLALAVVGTILLYALGYFTHIYGLGRTIAFSFIFMQLTMAVYFGSVHGSYVNFNKRIVFFTAVIFALLILVAWDFYPHFRKPSALILEEETRTSKSAGCRAGKDPSKIILNLQNKIPDSALVLTDPGTGRYISGLNGKVIAIDRPVYWVKDIKERRKALKDFFAPTISLVDKKKILSKYNPDYILINRWVCDCESTIQELLPVGSKVVYDQNCLVLIKLAK